MLPHRRADIHRHKVHTQFFTQLFRVAAGAVGGAEAGHGHRQNVLPGPVQRVHGPHHHQQGQGTVQPAGDAHHRLAAAGVLDPPPEAVGLQAEDLLRAAGQDIPIGRHERPGRDAAAQSRDQALLTESDPPAQRRAALVEAGVAVPLIAQAEQVDLRADKALFPKGRPLGQLLAVLIDQTVAGEHHVLGGFIPACVGIDIAAEQPCRGGGDQQSAVIPLADQFVGGGEVGDHRCPRQAQPGRGRHRRPEVLADLHAQHKVRHLPAAEQQIPAKGNFLSQQRNLRRSPVVRSGGELPLFVKLTVVGQHRFGHQSQHFTALEDGRAVIQLAAQTQGQPHHQQAALPCRVVPQGAQGLQRPVQQKVGIEQVPAGIARQVQLRQHQQICPQVLGRVKARLRALQVIGRIPQAQGRAGRCHFDKAILHISAPPVSNFC